MPLVDRKDFRVLSHSEDLFEDFEVGVLGEYALEDKPVVCIGG